MYTSVKMANYPPDSDYDNITDDESKELLIAPLCESPEHSSDVDVVQPTENRWLLWRNLCAFFLLGLCNNYAYVIMLSAANDILSSSFNDDGDSSSAATTTEASPTKRDCNPTSTAAILLADIIPSLVIKVLAPFIYYQVHLRSIVVIALSAGSFLLVSYSSADWMTYFGVVCASLSSGLGEVTYLTYSSVYDKNVVSTWSSGTGASGVLGAFTYAAFTSTAGISPRNTLLIMLAVPVIMIFSFWVVLRHPDGIDCVPCRNNSTSVQIPGRNEPSMPFREKLRLLPGLLPLMIPLCVVYFFEYFINQGLMEMFQFDNAAFDHAEQYRWLQVDYQIGVFISRSSVNLFILRQTWITAVLQGINAIILTFEAIYLYIPYFWIVAILVLWEGLMGGCAYVNTYYRITNETPEDKKAASMAIASMSDSFGVVLAAAISLPIHEAICKTPLPT